CITQVLITNANTRAITIRMGSSFQNDPFLALLRDLLILASALSPGPLPSSPETPLAPERWSCARAPEPEPCSSEPGRAGSSSGTPSGPRPLASLFTVPAPSRSFRDAALVRARDRVLLYLRLGSLADRSEW